MDEVTPVVRWTLVVALAATLVGVPTAIAHRPAGDADTTATRLRDRIDAASATAYSGYVETQGSLPLPDARGFTDVTSLFAGSSRLRVWWRSSSHWRVDTLSDTGETDLVADGNRLVRWEYDGHQATSFTEPAARLPRASDVLPPRLAQQALADAAADELTRLPPERIAGRDALGLRVTPRTPETTVGHVDVWTDRQIGLPLRVELYAVGARTPAFTSAFASLDLRTPSAGTVHLDPPPGATLRAGDVVDLADAADQYAPYVFPSELIGLPRSSEDQRGVGLYRSGPTWLIAMPMLERVAEPLKDQLRVTPGSAEDGQGVFAQLGPLSVLVTSHDGFDSHTLIAGTVTRDALREAARFLAHGGYVRGRDGAR